MTLATVAAASGEDVVPFDIEDTGRPIFSAFARARSKFGGKRVCIVDVDDSERSYDDIMRASLALGHAMLYSVQASLIPELFGTRLRYTGASLGYQLAAPIAGGSSPLIAAWLVHTFPGQSWPLTSIMSGHPSLS